MFWKHHFQRNPSKYTAHSVIELLLVCNGKSTVRVHVVEVTIFEERGKELSGYENAYFPRVSNSGMVERALLQAQEM
jgi:hypothetical protein